MDKKETPLVHLLCYLVIVFYFWIGNLFVVKLDSASKKVWKYGMESDLSIEIHLEFLW